MRGAVATIVAALLAASPITGSIGRAQGPNLDPALPDDRCAVCQQLGDDGAADARPPEAGHQSLTDLRRTLSNVALPKLSAGEIAAIVNYIRTAWDDDFDPATTEEIAAVIDALEGKAAEQVTIWDGVFTSDQIARGEAAYVTCSRCKSSSLSGAADGLDMIANLRQPRESKAHARES